MPRSAVRPLGRGIEFLLTVARDAAITNLQQDLLDGIEEAAKRLDQVALWTPLQLSKRLSNKYGATV